MCVREATPSDVPAMLKLHERAVREVRSRGYTPDQIEAWLSGPRR